MKTEPAKKKKKASSRFNDAQFQKKFGKAAKKYREAGPADPNAMPINISEK